MCQAECTTCCHATLLTTSHLSRPFPAFFVCAKSCQAEFPGYQPNRQGHTRLISDEAGSGCEKLKLSMGNKGDAGVGSGVGEVIW